MMRRLLVGMLGLSLAASACAGGGEREKAADHAAQKWLAIVDAGRYGESWDAAAELFRRALTRAQWEDALNKARSPLGKVLSRKLRSATFMTSVPGAPQGEYVVIEYDTDFENRKGATERVTPMKDPDGVWRVSGYYIR
ncbi:MAG: DUF4019 domain-containing protein [Thermoanaerobaculia bacterium]